MCVEIDVIGWFTKWIDIPIKKVFDKKKYILKNIKKHSTLNEIFKKLNEGEILEIKKKIWNIAIESCMFSSTSEKIKDDIANLKIKKKRYKND